MSTNPDISTLLGEILTGLKTLQQDNSELSSQVDAINGRVNMLAGIKQVQDNAANGQASVAAQKKDDTKPSESVKAISEQYDAGAAEAAARRSTLSLNKIILTSYPGQAGVDPIPMQWGHVNPATRGPVVVSRHANTIRRRNGTSVCYASRSEAYKQTQPSAPTADRTLSTMLWLSRARTWTSATSPTSPTPSLPWTLGRFPNGVIRRR